MNIMKKIYFLALAAMVGMSACAAQSDAGEARIVIPEKQAPKQIVVSWALMSNFLNARSEADLKLQSDTIEVKKGVATFKLDAAGDARYAVALTPQAVADFYASPGDNILVEVSSVNPLNYTVEGTDLMHGMTELQQLTTPIEAEYYALQQSGAVPEDKAMEIMNRYDAAIKDFVKRNPDSPAAVFAILDLEGQDYTTAYNDLKARGVKSMFMPMADKRMEQVKRQMAAQEQREQLTSGKLEAPGFTFKDLQGKNVSLSDFRGKWVVIDFWGSWCGWCIKGFPQLKEAYQKYGDKLVIIGVDCQDSEQAWRDAVKKYELPWVNVYNDQQGGELLTAYGVQGFPTKAIVNPEGKLVDLTTGEDPSFYDRLAKFMNSNN